MEDIEILRINLQDLKNAQKNIIEAMNNISKTEGLDEEYRQLDIIEQTIGNKIENLEIEIENLVEEIYYEENEEQWKAEQREQNIEYWADQF